MFQVEQKSKKDQRNISQSDSDSGVSQIDHIEMLREQNKAFQKNTSVVQAKKEEEELLQKKDTSEEKPKKKDYNWKPKLDDNKDLVLRKGRGDNAETLILQILESGYNVSEDMKKNLRDLCQNMQGNVLNLTGNVDKMSGDFRTTIELVSAQAKLADKDNNCVNLALVSLDEFKNSPENEKVVNKNFGSGKKPWKEDTDDYLDKNYTTEDQKLQGGRSVFISRDPEITDSKKNITHASRFFLKGPNGENYAVHKYGSGDKSPLRIRKSDEWSSGKNDKPTTVWNQKQD